MLLIEEDDLLSLQAILGRLYEDNGLTNEILMLSQLVDMIIVQQQEISYTSSQNTIIKN